MAFLLIAVPYHAAKFKKSVGAGSKISNIVLGQVGPKNPFISK